MYDVPLLSGLFTASFAAATVLPAQSEAVLIALLTNTDIPPWLLVMIASFGNILGSCVNWAIGRYAETYRAHRWFPLKPEVLDKSQKRYTRHGRWLLLLSWVPLIGDPITVIAGVMREKFLIFLALVTIAKSGRYILLAALVGYATAPM